jgi:hypothetical protein
MTDGAQRSQMAFERAVRRERAAIVLHEQAATMHEANASRLDAALLTAADVRHGESLRARAVAERGLADVARARAASVRARLTAEGVLDVG